MDSLCEEMRLRAVSRKGTIVVSAAYALLSSISCLGVPCLIEAGQVSRLLSFRLLLRGFLHNWHVGVGSWPRDTDEKKH